MHSDRVIQRNKRRSFHEDTCVHSACSFDCRRRRPAGSCSAATRCQIPLRSPGWALSHATVVDDFIDRVFVNATLKANPNIYKARKEVRKPGLKTQVSNLVCSATGGPCKYTGLDMKTAHKDFHITEKEWQALLVDFRASLAKFQVPAAE